MAFKDLVFFLSNRLVTILAGCYLHLSLNMPICNLLKIALQNIMKIGINVVLMRVVEIKEEWTGILFCVFSVRNYFNTRAIFKTLKQNANFHISYFHNSSLMILSSIMLSMHNVDILEILDITFCHVNIHFLLYC
jgi:hypothetical protein